MKVLIGVGMRLEVRLLERIKIVGEWIGNHELRGGAAKLSFTALFKQPVALS